MSSILTTNYSLVNSWCVVYYTDLEMFDDGSGGLMPTVISPDQILPFKSNTSGESIDALPLVVSFEEDKPSVMHARNVLLCMGYG